MKSNTNGRKCIRLQKELYYKFNDPELLIQALTIRSAGILKDNETLEFIGDRALELAVTDILTEKYPHYNEGTLNAILSSLVKNDGPLLELANKLKLHEYIISSSSINNRRLSDTMEAIIGAIFIDSGKSYEVIKGFIIRHWTSLNLNPTQVAFTTIQCENSKLLKGLLKTGVNPNNLNSSEGAQCMRYPKSYSLLYAAISEGSLKMVKVLLHSRADPNLMISLEYDKMQKFQTTPLLVAIKKIAEHPKLTEKQYARMINMLINHGADVNKMDSLGQLPLHVAVTINSCITGKLLECGAAPNIATKHEGYTPLHLLSIMDTYDSENVIKKLLAAGADINLKENYGNTPLHLAVKHRNIEVVRLLIEAGANLNVIDKCNRTPLHLSALYSTPEPAYKGNWDDYIKVCNGAPSLQIAQLLASNGANPIISDLKGQTPRDIIKKARSIAFRKDLNDTILALKEKTIREAEEKYHATIIMSKLAQTGNRIDELNDNGLAPLHEAVINGNVELVRLLIQAGANLDIVDKYNTTALHLSINCNLSNISDREDMDEYVADWDNIPCLQIMQLLISNGANPGIADQSGNIPRDIATKNMLYSGFFSITNSILLKKERILKKAEEKYALEHAHSIQISNPEQLLNAKTSDSGWFTSNIAVLGSILCAGIIGGTYVLSRGR